MRKLLRIAVSIAGVAGTLLLAAPAHADGGTMLTVTGKIANANRGALDPFSDALLNGHDLVFDKAFTFDRDALLSLGTHRVKAKYPGKDTVIEVEGPLLRDVLAKAGADGTTVTVTALDGYAADIPMSDIQAWPVVLAMKRSGEWLGIGGRGPLWVVYPNLDVPALADRDDAKWVWAAFFIKVE